MTEAKVKAQAEPGPRLNLEPQPRPQSRPWRGGSRRRPGWIGKRSPAPARAGRSPGKMWKRCSSRGAEEQRRRRCTDGIAAASSLPASSLQLPAPAPSIPFSGIRALIAERMVAGHSRTAPVTLTAEADATALVELRRQLAADGVAVSYNDLFLTILAKALAEHPRLNASLDGDTDQALAADRHRPGGGHRTRAAGAGGARRGSQGAGATGGGNGRAGRARPRRQVHARRTDRQHLHPDQPGDVRHRRVHADHQPAGVRHPGRGAHQDAAGLGRRSCGAAARWSG